MKSLTDLENLNNQIVLLRLDLNVPILDGKITDTNRIDKIIPTINFLLSVSVLFFFKNDLEKSFYYRTSGLKPPFFSERFHLVKYTD